MRVLALPQAGGTARCNFLMRGVYLPAGGPPMVEFGFSLLNKPLYVTLSAIGLGILLGGFLLVSRGKSGEKAGA